MPKNVSKDTQTANQTATPENKGCAWTNNEYHAIWTHKAILHSILNTILCTCVQVTNCTCIASCPVLRNSSCSVVATDRMTLFFERFSLQVSVWCCFRAFRAKYILDLVELGSLLFVWTRLLTLKPTLVTQYYIAGGLRCKRSCDLLPPIGRSRRLRRRRKIILARKSRKQML